MSNQFKSNIKSEAFWVRTLFTIVYLVIFTLLDLFVWALTLAQWLFTLFTGSPNRVLQRFADSLSQFTRQLLAYLGFASTEKPFPFQDWPEADDQFEEEDLSPQPKSTHAQSSAPAQEKPSADSEAAEANAETSARSDVEAR